MSKNIKLNDTDYNGVSTVQLPTTSGGTATFKDTDEIKTPSGSTTITENGTHDVTNFASAIVNVPTSGSSGSSENSYEMGTFTLEAVAYNYTYTHSLGRVPKFVILYPISIVKDGSHTPYAISQQTLLKGLGQEDYNIASNDTVHPNNIFGTYQGVGYSSTVSGSSVVEAQRYIQLIEMTSEYVKVGKMVDQITNSGHLTVGTYGIIVG